MKLPRRILSRVRGPMVAAAVIGCSSTPAAPIETEPVEPAAVVVPSVDPVDYDAQAEDARLERVDRALAAAESRRTRRVEAEEEAHAQRTRDRAPSGGIGTLGLLGRDPDFIHAGCGRG